MPVYVSVRDIMITDFPRVDKNDSIYHAVKLMEKHDLDRAVVTDAGRLAGVVTKKDIIIKLGAERRRTLSPGRMRVSGFMSINPITVEPSTPIPEAASLMVEQGISGLPVVEEGRLVGLVTKWELLRAVEGDNTPLSALSVTVPIALRTTDTLLHARKMLLDNDLPMLPVMDEENRLVGTVSLDEIADVLFAFYDLVPAKYRRERIHNILVSDFMRLRPPRMPGDASLGEAAALMRGKRYRGVVIVSGELPTGLVTLNETTMYIAGRI